MFVLRGRSVSAHVYLLAILGVALSVGSMLLWSARSAGAQEYPITDGDLTVSDSSVAPGSSIAVSGEGFAPGTEVIVTIEWGPIELTRVNADAAGRFNVTVTIPANLPPGNHTIKASGEAAGGGTLVLSTEIFVEGDLPFTGTALPVGLLAAGGLLLVAAGAVSVRLVRR